jgi:hypothetical protein
MRAQGISAGLRQGVHSALWSLAVKLAAGVRAGAADYLPTAAELERITEAETIRQTAQEASK